MEVEIGSVWNTTVLNNNVIIIQTPGRLVLFMTKDGKYGSASKDNFLAQATLVKSREEVLST